MYDKYYSFPRRSPSLHFIVFIQAEILPHSAGWFIGNEMRLRVTFNVKETRRRISFEDPSHSVFVKGCAMASKQEIEFIDSIDASFPFENEEDARKVLSIGAGISDNAALMICLEFINEPTGKFIDLSLSLLEQLCHERPTQEVIIATPVIKMLIRKIHIPGGHVLDLLEYCREHNGCYNAVGILSLCSPMMEEEAKKILANW
ncbi:MAG: hypothetical protein HZB23_12920 [Deltaproteobacteria bacterium]|nr:hypothetical protein [Deltaproteobacteria bacterium]